jgi:hypothetical protein
MPSVNTVEKFVDLVTAGHFIEAMEQFYATDATAQENSAPPRVGLPALLEHERATLGRSERIETRCPSPPLIDGDRVIIHWRFVFHVAGRSTVLEELAYQTWRGEQLVAERFFYDSRQLRP